ncbi:hypothetical protein AN477_11760 [Alicyclobacillus ferrooxydans]|uniref:Uncharacterized protein n=1 Tax=Alicyclobacillus ferrooxydans TaxID=471514 RepID=A0A0P9EWK5_9BACL|nr:hypothetical protein AN477_11760 [Alicyclobacillus ferrooxydans]
MVHGEEIELKAPRVEEKLRWYKITGQCLDQRSVPVIAFVEATSLGKVLRYHGGRRRHITGPNGDIEVQFAKDKQAVQLLGKRLKPERIQPDDPSSIIQVIPATRYRCSCGKELVSDYSYPSMWCSCGLKAYPVQDEKTGIRLYYTLGLPRKKG